jgi:L-fucose isomerase-like protein
LSFVVIASKEVNQMVIKPVVGVYGVLEKTEEGWHEAEALIEKVRGQLSSAGLDVRLAPELVADESSAVQAVSFFKKQDPDLILAVVITWSFDHLSVRILKGVDRPLAILAVPGIRSGSIVGAHQLGSYLTDLDIERFIFYGPPERPDTFIEFTAYARAAAVKRRLELGKLGFVGRRTPGMTPIAFDEVEITRLFGPQVNSYGWEEIEARADSVSPDAVTEAVRRMKTLAGTVESTDQALQESLRLYLALRSLSEENEILAFGLGCYPHYAGIACIITGLLSEDGIPTACEGDMNSAILMYLLQQFSGEPVHFGELLDLDEKENTIVTSHCGCASPRLAVRPKDIALTPVRLFERGVCIKFPAKASPNVTFANLAGRKGTYRLCAVEGSAIQTQMIFEGNPVKMKPDLGLADLLDVINEHGFGHHWMMGYAHAGAELKAFCRLSGIKGVFPV